MYSLPTRLIDARQPKGGRATDANDYPEHKRAYAVRNVAFLQRQAEQHGESVELYVARLLNSWRPWTRIRQGYGLLGLVCRFRLKIDKSCGTALAINIYD